MNKTGTQSLAKALRTLGLKTVHYGDLNFIDAVARAIDDGHPPFEYAPRRYRKADAYADIVAIVRNFDTVDQLMPGSKFILSTRDLDAWLDSRERHVLANQRDAPAGIYRGSWLTVAREKWVRQREEHHERVLSYFADRPDDLLVWNVSTDARWEPLAEFLGLPAPDVPFPWLNREGKGSYQRQPRRWRWRRAAGRLRRKP